MSGLPASDYLLLKCGSDPVWHEMLVCGLGQGGLLSVHTSDGDSYEMPTFDERKRGPERMEKVDRDDQLPEDVRKEVYRFSECPSSAKLRKLIKTGQAEMVEGERWKDWRSLCREISVAEFPDWPFDGAWTAVHLLRHGERLGHLPFFYLEWWANNKKVEEIHRICLEMKVLMEGLELLGTHDQLHLDPLAGVVGMRHRLLNIFGAYAETSVTPNFEPIRWIFNELNPADIPSRPSGMGDEMEPAAPELRTHSAKKGRHEGEIEESGRTARELRNDVNAAQPNSESASSFSGMGAEMQVVGPVSRSHFTEEARDEADVVTVRELRQAPTPKGGE